MPIIIIYVQHEAPAAAVARVEALADDVAQRDADFNGADIRVRRDDFTWVEDSNELRGAKLLRRVEAALQD